MTQSEDAGNQPSKVEAIKAASAGLRGTIAAALGDEATGCFTEDDKQLLKFHGIYQQDDRDNRRVGSEKSYSMMIRLNIPGGKLTASQYLALDRLADTYANGTLRITTRQSIQYHGVLKGDLKETLAEINRVLLSTLAACGDVQRNVMASPAPYADEVHRTVQRVAAELTAALAPATGAYHEIWLDGERVLESGEEEPFYGRQYLPRKFKTGIAIDTDNSIDLYTYDCGLIAITDRGRVLGFNLVAGGGLGMTHNKADTFARMASVLGFVPPEHAVDAVRAVAAAYRDLGNRSDRRHARLKYLIEELGVERFIEEVHARTSWRLAPPAPMPEPRQHDHVGLFEQGDGKWFLGVFVQNGRIADRGETRYRSAFRRIAEKIDPGIRLTPMQSILFTDLTWDQVDLLRTILAEHGVPEASALSSVRRHSMACPALPTCGLALTDAERQFPDVLLALEQEFERLGIGDAELTVRMTGCPNGCARPYNADIGFVGRKPGVYHIFVGGGLGGDRLADLFAADVPVAGFVPSLQPLLNRFATERLPREGIGAFYRRITGRTERRVLLTGKETPTAPLVALTVRGAAVDREPTSAGHDLQASPHQQEAKDRTP
jgi:sulfite reductase beta subunit-like hemoprotein